MLVNIIQNTISSFRSALAAAEVITTNLKMWLGFETSETLGTEEVVNGDYSNGLTGWSTQIPSGQVVEVVNNQLHIDYDASETQNSTGVNQTIFDANKTYQIEVDIESITGTIRIQAGGVVNDFNTDGIKTFIVKPTSAILYIIRSSNGNNVDAVINNITVKELTQITPDKSGNNNVGELFTGKALDFNGSTEYVNTTGFEMSGTSATFAFWIYPKDTAYQFVMDLDGTVRTILGLFNAGSGQVFAFFNSGFKQFGTPIQNQWQRVVFRVNASTVECYVDGVKSGSTLALTSPIDLSTVGNSVIGGRYDTTNAANRFDGSLSDFQIYNAYWSTDDIAYDYANPNKLAIDNPSTSLSVTNLKAYWALSEGDGLVAYDSGTNLEEEEVVDGDFSSETNWVLSSASISDNKCTMTSVGGASTYFYQTGLSLTQNKSYKISFKATRISGDTNLAFSSFTGTNVPNSPTISQSGEYSFDFTPSSTVPNFGLKRVTGNSGAVWEIENFSVREVTASDHGGLINGAVYVDAQPRIPQLGMMNWAKSTPVADEVTLIPNPTIPTQDIFGNAVRDRLNSFNLDGTGYAEVADDASINPTTEITVQCWIQSNTESDRGLVAKWKNPSPKDYMLYKLTSNFRFYIGGNFGTSNTIPTSGWVNIAGTYDGSNIKTYINGVLSTTTALTGSIPNNSNTLDIGRYNEANGTPYSERISDVLLYDTALDADEIENNYNAGLSAHTN